MFSSLRKWLFIIIWALLISILGSCTFGMLQPPLPPTQTNTPLPSATSTTKPVTVQDFAQEVLPKLQAYYKAYEDLAQLTFQLQEDPLKMYDPLWKADVVFALDELDEAGLSLTNNTNTPPSAADVNRWLKLIGEETQVLSFNYRSFLRTYDMTYIYELTTNFENIGSYATRATEELEKLR